MNVRSAVTAPLMMSCTTLSGRGFCSMVYNMHANSVCRPSSREISSLEKVNPGKGNNPLSETVIFLHPLYGPLSFLLNCWHRVDSVEDHLLFGWLFDVLLDEEGIGLRVDVLHCHLEPIECASFRDLHFCGKLGSKILQH